METVKTQKGTTLPLITLKGKPYLQVMHRMQWMNEEVPQFTIETELLQVTDEQTLARAKVVLMDKEGKVVKSATATKRETKKDFTDHTEKAETAAIGRALAMLGFGTQFAVADLDEGDRLADSPVPFVKSATKPTTQVSVAQNNTTIVANQPLPAGSVQTAPTEVKKPSFRDKVKKLPAVATPVSNGGDSW